MRSTFSWGLRLILMLSVPATLGLIVLAEPIVRLIFERGQFDAESTALTAGALAFYAPGIIGYSIVKIASPSFYALQDSRTPMAISVIAIAVNLGLNLWLHTVMGFRGLALGSAIAANVNAVLLLWLLSRRIEGIDFGRVAVSLGKILVASLLMAAAARWTEAALAGWLPAPWLGGTLLPRAISVFGAMAAGIGVLALAAWALRIEEFRLALARVTARFRRSPERR
jgi:putative peptidoglycan lipid II flippase